MDNRIILCWNVRGLNDRARRDAVRTLVDDVHPTIVCLQETKLDVITQHLVFALLGISFNEFAYLQASNTQVEFLSLLGSLTYPSWMSMWAATLLLLTSGSQG